MTAVTIRNSREGEAPPEPPTHDDGTLYPFAMHYDGYKYVAYGDAPEDLLAVLIADYAEKDQQGRLQARIELAINAQVRIQALINAETDPETWNALAGWEREVLNGPRYEQPHGWAAEQDEPMGDVWDPDIPLVLVDTGYAPFTEIEAPISGVADVVDPPNMVWLRPRDEWEFLVSLANAGFISLHQAADL